MTTGQTEEPHQHRLSTMIRSKLAWLFQSDSKVLDPEDRQHSQLLSGLLLTVIVVGSLIIGYALYLDPRDIHSPQLIAGMIGIAVLVGLYIVNRLGHLRAASIGFIVLLAVMFILPPAIGGSPEFLAFAMVPMLVTGMFFSLRWTAAMTGIIIVVVFISNSLTVQDARWWSRLSIWYFLCFSGALVITFIRHNHRLESLRRRSLEIANEKLQNSELLLEKRVQERTRDLEVAADVSRQITTFLGLDELLQAVVERTKAGFGLYHVSVFLYDSRSQQLKLESGAGEVGAAMKAEGRRFHVLADRGLVPEAARQRQAVVINDVQADAQHVVNPHLPQTRSEVALPMILGDTLIGILDLQSEQVNRFGADDLRVMKTMADQIAVAVQNATLYAEQVTVAEELRAVDKLKSQFLASMSHELRTPLNAILNFTEFVSLGMFGPVNEQQVDALNKTLESAKHLLSLINDVLDMSKIESGAMKLFVEDNIDLHEELSPVIATAQTLLKDKPVQFVQDIATQLPSLSGDRRRIRQILLNLISNAAKFTEEGSVTLKVRGQGAEILFGVIDTGPGIAADDQQIIFEPFIQTDSGIKHMGGTGLGLPISRRLAESHGGRLWVESEPGAGAAFYVTLPLHPSPKPVRTEGIVEQHYA